MFQDYETAKGEGLSVFKINIKGREVRKERKEEERKGKRKERKGGRAKKKKNMSAII